MRTVVNCRIWNFVPHLTCASLLTFFARLKVAHFPTTEIQYCCIVQMGHNFPTSMRRVLIVRRVWVGQTKKNRLTYIHSESETNRQTRMHTSRERERLVVKQWTTYNELCNVSPVRNVTHAIHWRVTQRQAYYDKHTNIKLLDLQQVTIASLAASSLVAKLNDGCACRIFAPSVCVNREKWR